MRRHQPSIAGLLGLIAIAAIGCAVVRSSPQFMDTALSMLMALALLASFLVSVFGRGPGRAFGVSFALFGGASWLVNVIPEWRDGFGRHLPTTTILDRVSERCFPYPPDEDEWELFNQTLKARIGFVRVGQTLIAFSLGVSIGFGALWWTLRHGRPARWVLEQDTDGSGPRWSMKP